MNATKTVPKRSGLLSQHGTANDATERSFVEMPSFPASQASAAPSSLATHLKRFRMGAGGGLLLPIELIDRSPYQNRTYIDEEHVLHLKESIENGSMIEAIVVRSKDDGRFELIAGEHRLHANKAANRVEIEAVVRDCDDTTAAKFVLIDNLLHRPLSDYETYLGLSKLRDLVGEDMSVRAIARETGHSSSSVQRLLSFGRLPDGARALLDEQPGAVSATTAEQLAPYSASKPDAVTEAVKMVIQGDLLQGRAAAWVDVQGVEPVAPPTKPQRHERVFNSSSGKPAAKFVRTGNRISVSVAGGDHGIDAEALAAEIERVLERFAPNQAASQAA